MSKVKRILILVLGLLVALNSGDSGSRTAPA